MRVSYLIQGSLIIFLTPQQPPADQGLLNIEASRSHPDTPHSVGLLWTTETLPDNTQLSQETDIHASSGIRIHNPSKKAVADPRLRPGDYWDRPFHLTFLNLIILRTSWWRAPVLSSLKPKQAYCSQYLVLRHPHQVSWKDPLRSGTVHCGWQVPTFWWTCCHPLAVSGQNKVVTNYRPTYKGHFPECSSLNNSCCEKVTKCNFCALPFLRETNFISIQNCTKNYRYVYVQ